MSFLCASTLSFIVVSQKRYHVLLVSLSIHIININSFPSIICTKHSNYTPPVTITPRNSS